MMREITAYVDWAGNLVTGDTEETIRVATPSERKDSREERTGTGKIIALVSERALRSRCPKWVQAMQATGQW